MLKLVIYARGAKATIDNQLYICREYAKSHSYEIVSEYIDSVESSKIKDRPAFQQMIEDSKKHHFEKIVVSHYYRFARNRLDSVTYNKLLKENGVTVASVVDVIDDGPVSEIQKFLLASIEEYYQIQNTLLKLDNNCIERG